jgi:hypothetical protein
MRLIITQETIQAEDNDDTFGFLHFAGFPEGGAANSDFTLRGQFSLGHVLG